VALDLVGFGIVLPILPLYAEQFGADAVSATALVASFSGAQLVFSPVWGRVSDRVGRKPLLVLSLAGTAVGSLITGLAGSLGVLFLGRVLDGISGASVSVAQAAVADIAPPEERARLLGLLGAAFGLGFVAGPAIGALAALGGPEVPFLLAAGLAAVNAVVAARRLPETHPGRSAAASGSPVGSAARTGGRTGVLALVAVSFTALTAFSAFEATFALFAEHRLGLRLASVGGVFAGVGLLLVLVQVRLVGPTVARLGEGGTVRAGLLVNAVGLLLVAASHSWALLVPALVLLVVGQGLATPAMSSLVAGKVGPERRGGVLGVQQAAGGLARVVGPLAGGVLFQHVGVPAPYLAGAGVMVLAAAAVRKGA
jgi:multidrug resistance protein